MTEVYACLAGNWVNLCDDSECVMGVHRQTPYTWYEEGGEIWSPITKDDRDTYYQLDYIWIHYKDKDYRVNPIFIQIVVE